MSDEQIKRDRILLITGIVMFLIGSSPWWLLHPLGLTLHWRLGLIGVCGFGIVGIFGFFIMILGAVFYMERPLLPKEETDEGVARAYGFYGTLLSVLAALVLLVEMLLGLWFITAILMLIGVLSFLGLFMGLHGSRIEWNPWILAALILSTEVIVIQILYAYLGVPTL